MQEKVADVTRARGLAATLTMAVVEALLLACGGVTHRAAKTAA